MRITPGAGGGGSSSRVGPSDVVFVDPAGLDASGQRGNAAKPFKTVRAAVAAMTTPGDMVAVAPGIFDETAGGGTITEPVAVTRWSLIGYGFSSAAAAGTPTGTIITHTTQDLFTLRNTCTGFSFNGVTLKATGANKRAIVADGTGGGGATMTAGLVGSNATLEASAGFLFRDLGIVDMSTVDVGAQTSAATVDTCSSVRLSNVEFSTDLNLSWNEADASKPVAGRVLMLLQSLRVTGDLTLDRQVKLVGDGGCKIGNLRGGANLVVSGGLALSQVWAGSKFGTFGSANGIIDFTTNPLPDTAINVVCGFWTCSLFGQGTFTFEVGGAGVNRQRINLDNATFDADPGGPKTVHAGRATDFDCTNTSWGPGVVVTADATATFGQRLGIVNLVQDFFGGQRVGVKKITNATGAYTTASGDFEILVDTSTGAISDITLLGDGGAPANVGRVLVFQDMGGQAQVNPFNILAPGGGSINGAASITVDQNYAGLVLLTFDGQNWFTPACCAAATLSFGTLAFARGTEGSYLIQAPTTGAVPFLSWAAAGVLRREDRGDGAGPLPLLERLSTNFVLDNRVYNTGNWNASGTPTANDVTAPDGPVTAFRIQAADTAFGPYQQVIPGAGNYVLSGWVRSHSGTGSSVLDWSSGGTLGTAFYSTPSTTWNRVIGNPIGAFSGYFVDTNDGRDTSAIAGGHINGARDACVDLIQVELGAYPTSAIRGTGNAVTSRFADVLWGVMPAWMKTLPTHIAQLSPNFANTDLVNGDVRWLFTLDSANDGVYIDKTGGNVTIKAVVGGVVKATSAVLTFAAFALLGPIIINPITAVITVNGVAGAAGTPWTWAGRTNIRVGGIYAGAGNELDGRIADNWTSV